MEGLEILLKMLSENRKREVMTTKENKAKKPFQTPPPQQKTHSPGERTPNLQVRSAFSRSHTGTPQLDPSERKPQAATEGNATPKKGIF